MHDEIAGTCGEHVLEKQRIISVKGDQRATLLLYCPGIDALRATIRFGVMRLLPGGKPLLRRVQQSPMAWRTAGRLGWGDGPLILFFPPRLCETAMLEECVGDHGHECTPMDRRSGSRTWVSSTFQETKRGSSVNTGCRERRNIISPICRLKRGPKRGEASFQPTLGAVSPTHILPLGIGQHVFGRPRQDVRNVPLAGGRPRPATDGQISFTPAGYTLR